MRNRITAFALMTEIVASALLIISLAAYAQQSSDKSVISLSTVSKLDRSQPGIYRTKVGKFDVIAVSDGTVGLGLTKELIQNAKPGEVERLLARHFEKSPIDASINAFLIKYEGKLILIDAGSSELVGPTGGKLRQSLRAAGAPPENITDVFVTHIHPDHTGGLMNGNTKVFPNATIRINKREVTTGSTSPLPQPRSSRRRLSSPRSIQRSSHTWTADSSRPSKAPRSSSPDSAPSRLTATLRA
jgi:beta-lactamase superfamily II metal-dependent hydrolase